MGSGVSSTLYSLNELSLWVFLKLPEILLQRSTLGEVRGNVSTYQRLWVNLIAGCYNLLYSYLMASKDDAENAKVSYNKWKLQGII